MKKALSLLLTLTLISASVVGCGAEASDSTNATLDTTTEESSSDSSEVTKIRVGYFGTSALTSSPIVAMQEGYYDEIFAEDNVEVEFINFMGGPAINEAFLAGEIDIAASIADLPVVSGIVGKNIDVQVLGTVNVWPTTGIVVAEDSGIESVADLAGKSIALSIGTGMHKVTLHILDDNGLSADEVEFVNLSGPDSEAALASGDVDAIVEYGYDFTTAEERGIGRILADSPENPQYWYIESTGTFINEHPDLVKKFLKATIQGQELLQSDPDKAYQDIADVTGLDFDYVKTTLDPTDVTVQLTTEAIENLYETNDFLLDQGLLDKGASQEEIDAHISHIIEEIDE